MAAEQVIQGKVAKHVHTKQNTKANWDENDDKCSYTFIESFHKGTEVPYHTVGLLLEVKRWLQGAYRTCWNCLWSLRPHLLALWSSRWCDLNSKPNAGFRVFCAIQNSFFHGQKARNPAFFLLLRSHHLVLHCLYCLLD